VIDAIGQTALNFGYATFNFNIVETLGFLVAAFIYNEAIENFELTTAYIEVKLNNQTFYADNLNPATNQITVQDIESNYQILVSKENYQAVLKVLSRDELVACFINPLTIILTSDSVNITRGLIGYYAFENNVLDNGTYHNNGVNYTNDNFIDGINGKALDFNESTDYIILTNTLNCSQSLSFSFLIESNPEAWSMINPNLYTNTR
jgi:hypothetical protein